MAILKLVPSKKQSVEDVINAAKEAGLTDVVIIGWAKDDTCYMDSTYEDGPPVLWLLEIARMALMDAAKGDS